MAKTSPGAARGFFRVGRAAGLAAALLAAASGAAVAQGFTPTGPLGTARARAAAALAGGRVLLAGGSPYGGACLPIDSAELYDPATGFFTATGPLVHPRCEARAVALDDGRVLVVGGIGAGIGDAELFDPASGTFTLAGPMLSERGAGFTVTKLSDGRVLVAGGDNFDGTLDTAEIFDPSTSAFQATGVPMTTPRSLHSATLLDDGRVLLAGGGAGFTCLPVAATAELYDPAADAFTPAPGVPVSALWGHAAAPLPGGRVLLAGGEPTCGLTSTDGTREAQIFDAATGRFSTAGPMLEVHGMGAAATSLDDGRVLVSGGYAGAGPVAAAELFDPDDRSFGQPSAMSSRRAFHAQVALGGGQALAAGGEDGPITVTATADRYTAPPPSGGGAPLAALVQVVPRTINLRSEGRFITVFVGVPGHRCGAIDRRSIRLSVGGRGAIAPQSGGRGCGDHDGDGTGDLMLKFSRAEAAGLAPAGGLVPFEITGTLKNGAPFVGVDLVRILLPGRGSGGR